MPEVSQDKATIGRKVWLWHSEADLDEHSDTVLDHTQGFDGTVVFVHPDGKVSVAYHDHGGDYCVHNNGEALVLYDYTGTEAQGHGGVGAEDQSFCTWMPYQKAQHDKHRLGNEVREAGKEEKAA